jgi:hypothetical protein
VSAAKVTTNTFASESLETPSSIALEMVVESASGVGWGVPVVGWEVTATPVGPRVIFPFPPLEDGDFEFLPLVPPFPPFEDGDLVSFPPLDGEPLPIPIPEHVGASVTNASLASYVALR